MIAVAVVTAIPSFAVTDKEMEQARAIAAKHYLRYANNGSDYLDKLTPSSVGFFDALALLRSHVLIVGRDSFKLCADDFHAASFKEFLNIVKLVESSVDEPFFVLSLQFSIEVHEFEFEILQTYVRIWLHMEYALMVEKE